jgi:hypothetical protein
MENTRWSHGRRNRGLQINRCNWCLNPSSSFFSTVCWRLNRWDKCAQNQEISNETQQISRRTTRKHVVLREIHTWWTKKTGYAEVLD